MKKLLKALTSFLFSIVIFSCGDDALIDYNPINNHPKPNSTSENKLCFNKHLSYFKENIKNKKNVSNKDPELIKNLCHSYIDICDKNDFSTNELISTLKEVTEVLKEAPENLLSFYTTFIQDCHIGKDSNEILKNILKTGTEVFKNDPDKILDLYKSFIEKHNSLDEFISVLRTGKEAFQDAPDKIFDLYKLFIDNSSNPNELISVFKDDKVFKNDPDKIFDLYKSFIDKCIFLRMPIDEIISFLETKEGKFTIAESSTKWYSTNNSDKIVDRTKLSLDKSLFDIDPSSLLFPKLNDVQNCIDKIFDYLYESFIDKHNIPDELIFVLETGTKVFKNYPEKMFDLYKSFIDNSSTRDELISVFKTEKQVLKNATDNLVDLLQLFLDKCFGNDNWGKKTRSVLETKMEVLKKHFDKIFDLHKSFIDKCIFLKMPIKDIIPFLKRETEIFQYDHCEKDDINQWLSLMEGMQVSLYDKISDHLKSYMNFLEDDDTVDQLLYFMFDEPFLKE